MPLRLNGKTIPLPGECGGAKAEPAAQAAELPPPPEPHEPKKKKR